MLTQPSNKKKISSLPTEKEDERCWVLWECVHCGHINLNDTGIKGGSTNRMKRGRLTCKVKHKKEEGKKTNQKVTFGPHVLAIFSIAPQASAKAKKCQDRLNGIIECDKEMGYHSIGKFVSSSSYRTVLNKSVSKNFTWDGKRASKPVERGMKYRLASGGAIMPSLRKMKKHIDSLGDEEE